MTRTVLYDGLNLSLKAGTGVATYTRSLLGTARQLGYRTGVVYSSPDRVPKNPLLREIMLFDDGTEPKLSPKKLARRWLRRQLGAPLGLAPASVPLTGTVVLRSHQNRVSPDDSIFVQEDLFHRARHHFRRYGRALSLRFASPPDLLHCTYPIPLKVRGAPAIYTIHDLVPLRLPYLTDDDKRYHYRLLRTLIARADHIVTVSETSRRDIIRVFGMDERRITNTYQAVDVPNHIRSKPVDTVASEIGGVFNLDWKRYFLFFGALEPKKNIGRLIEAYLGAQTDLPLVIVGAAGWRSQGERELIDDERLGFYVRTKDRIVPRRQIMRFDYVSFPMLMSLIRGARGVLFPSLYEGFGLPVLESMQLGTPVVSSTEGSVPEVAGDAALLIDPYDTDALRQAIRTLAADDDLCAGLAAAGPAQADRFSPARYLDAVRGGYESILGTSTVVPAPWPTPADARPYPDTPR